MEDFSFSVFCSFLFFVLCSNPFLKTDCGSSCRAADDDDDSDDDDVSCGRGASIGPMPSAPDLVPSSSSCSVESSSPPSSSSSCSASLQEEEEEEEDNSHLIPQPSAPDFDSPPREESVDEDGGGPLSPDKKECPICLVEEPDAVLVPCGHLVCVGCAKQIKVCPMCRKRFERVVKIYG